ncbi:hypothetical protein BG910_04900 [Neisseria chenwenguii]|uniref:Uncharacterized protein n=1 Tax=Neisseria chenwenguii TaxID=1853278 RepID=A0A220S123_9NEIS|nr:hypothetical protein [Neisseria chenwenguii]ASK27164.1 hypothetical protein BG910_04900 [Neisseria chenwenguii]
MNHAEGKAAVSSVAGKTESLMEYLNHLGVLENRQYNATEKQLMASAAEAYFQTFRRSKTFLEVARKHRKDAKQPHPGSSPEYISGMKSALEKALAQNSESDGW